MNLLLVASGRFIVIVTGKDHLMYDTQMDEWIRLIDVD